MTAPDGREARRDIELDAALRREETHARAQASRARVVLDRVLSIAAAFVALCALAVSVYQTHIMREQQRLGAWPSLSLYQSNVEGYKRVARNVGLGPVLVRQVEVRVDSQPARRWGVALERLVGGAYLDSVQQDTASRIVTSYFGRGSVLLPGESLEMLSASGPVARRLNAEAARLSVRVCYCSFYADCWEVTTDAVEPSPVRACPAAADTTRDFGS